MEPRWGVASRLSSPFWMILQAIERNSGRRDAISLTQNQTTTACWALTAVIASRRPLQTTGHISVARRQSHVFAMIHRDMSLGS
jgi:hypothetical protein